MEYEPKYESNQVAKPDGNPFYTETLELDIPIYQRNNGSDTDFQSGMMKTILKKTGRIVQAVFHRFIPSSLTIPEANWEGYWSTDPSGLIPEQPGIRIPRRFLPIVDWCDDFPAFTTMGNGNTTLPVEVWDDNEKTLGWLVIYTVDNGVGHGYIEIHKLKKVDEGDVFKKNHSGLVSTEHESWLTDSAYNNIPENQLSLTC
jgi:hypothetical protein